MIIIVDLYKVRNCVLQVNVQPFSSYQPCYKITHLLFECKIFAPAT